MMFRVCRTGKHLINTAIGPFECFEATKGVKIMYNFWGVPRLLR